MLPINYPCEKCSKKIITLVGDFNFLLRRVISPYFCATKAFLSIQYFSAFALFWKVVLNTVSFEKGISCGGITIEGIFLSVLFTE